MVTEFPGRGIVLSVFERWGGGWEPAFFKKINLFIYLFIYLFIFGCVGSLLLCAWAFSSCGERGLLFVAVRRLLIAVASLVAEHGL